VDNTSCKNNSFEGNTILEHKYIAICFNHVLFTNWIGRWLLTTKRSRSYKNCLCYTSLFMKGSFAWIVFYIALLNTLGLFFVNCLSHTPLIGVFISSNLSMICIQGENTLWWPLWDVTLYYFLGLRMFECFPLQTFERKFHNIFAYCVRYNLSKILKKKLLHSIL
jgi:hypothetical protein